MRLQVVPDVSPGFNAPDFYTSFVRVRPPDLIRTVTNALRCLAPCHRNVGRLWVSRRSGVDIARKCSSRLSGVGNTTSRDAITIRPNMGISMVHIDMSTHLVSIDACTSRMSPAMGISMIMGIKTEGSTMTLLHSLTHKYHHP